jgi:hypothetical protein
VLREERCILCGKNERFFKLIFRRPKGKNKYHERGESNKIDNRKILIEFWVQMIWFGE